MTKSQRIIGLIFRILFGLFLLGIHFLVFPIPVVEAFMAYVIIFNPKWFRDMLNSMAEKDR